MLQPGTGTTGRTLVAQPLPLAEDGGCTACAFCTATRSAQGARGLPAGPEIKLRGSQRPDDPNRRHGCAARSDSVVRKRTGARSPGFLSSAGSATVGVVPDPESGRHPHPHVATPALMQLPPTRGRFHRCNAEVPEDPDERAVEPMTISRAVTESRTVPDARAHAPRHPSRWGYSLPERPRSMR